MPGFIPPYPPKPKPRVVPPADYATGAHIRPFQNSPISVADTSGGAAPPPAGGGGGGGGTSRAPTKAAAPSGAGKDPIVAAGFSQAYANQLYDLQNQWEIIAGYAQPITTDQLVAMAKQHVVGMGEFSRYIWQNVLAGKPDPAGKQQLSGIQTTMPWLQFGMDVETYHSRLSQLASDWQRYTGQVLNPQDGDLGQKWVEGQLGGVTPGLAAPSIIDDPALQKAFGWVKYGLTFRDFQLKKEQMDDAFGSTLTTEAAITQLHYFHQAQGAASQARAVSHAAGQQAVAGELATAVVR